ncbi:hypothetical protein ILUMI_04597 [Ignelater luminosus]|uniref:Uncharacterized protein n=1 Tax=Ignelater luminosus TaxID=2038154 RepID=A0A8K0D9D1_IGNLU|nr:hypothetical protein ILUMI_04597 [Ignelater luminosus]
MSNRILAYVWSCRRSRVALLLYGLEKSFFGISTMAHRDKTANQLNDWKEQNKMPSKVFACGFAYSLIVIIYLAKLLPAHIAMKGQGGNLENIKQVMKFKYLGIDISGYGDIDKKVRSQVRKAPRTSTCLNSKIWQNKHLRIKTKSRIYKTAIRPRLAYTRENQTGDDQNKKNIRNNRDENSAQPSKVLNPGKKPIQKKEENEPSYNNVKFYKARYSTM